MVDKNIKIKYSEKSRKFDKYRHSNARASVKFGKGFNTVDVIFDDYVNAPDEHIYDTGVMITVTKGMLKDVYAQHFVEDKSPIHRKGNFLDSIKDLSDKDIESVCPKDARVAIIIKQAKLLIVENLISQKNKKEKTTKSPNCQIFQRER